MCRCGYRGWRTARPTNGVYAATKWGINGLDHVAVVVALLGGERAEEHDAGVVDQNVGSAELACPACAVMTSPCWPG
jgi:hypothetical protein